MLLHASVEEQWSLLRMSLLLQSSPTRRVADEGGAALFDHPPLVPALFKVALLLGGWSCSPALWAKSWTRRRRSGCSPELTG
jgi:hypothetical protein